MITLLFLLTCSFDGLIVTCTLLIKFGCGEQSYRVMLWKALEAQPSDCQGSMWGNYHFKRLAWLVEQLIVSNHEFSFLLIFFSKPFSQQLRYVFSSSTSCFLFFSMNFISFRFCFLNCFSNHIITFSPSSSTPTSYFSSFWFLVFSLPKPSLFFLISFPFNFSLF